MAGIGGRDGETTSGVALGEGELAAAEISEASDGIDQVGTVPLAALQLGLRVRGVVADEEPATENSGTPEMDDTGGTKGVPSDETTGGGSAPVRGQREAVIFREVIVPLQ